MMKTDIFQKIIQEIEKFTSYLTFYFQGEPYLHPEFLSLIRQAHDAKMYTTTSTNAHYLDFDTSIATIKSGLNRLIISIDGADQESYQSYRKGGSLKKVLEGTANIIKARKVLKSKTPVVIWQFLVVRPNEHQIEEIKELAIEYGVDKVAFKTAQIYDFKNGNELIPLQKKYARYKKQKDGTFKIKNKLLDHCWKMWSSCVITWDGQVIPCCFDKDAQHSIGTLSKKSFAEIWRSEQYSRFRASVLRSRSEIEMCKNCTEGSKIWA
jgi:radical SAM protein with 4Fe4S-binding SPASM domain